MNAKNRFKRHKHIICYLGDSGEILPSILKDINQPCLFWLDGHYSSGITAKGELNTPIKNELKSIFNHQIKDHIILIDDARLFNGQDDYPEIQDLKNIVVNQYKCNFYVENDIIIITKQK